MMVEAGGGLRIVRIARNVAESAMLIVAPPEVLVLVV
jgi:hypothetical protein